MTTDAATAVATPEVETQVSAPEVQAETYVPESNIQSGSADAPTETVDTEAVAESPEAFDVTTLPEYQEVVKAPDPEISKDAAAPAMPGESVESFSSRLEAKLINDHRQFLQMAEPDWKAFLENELGLSRQDAHNVYHGKLGPILRNVTTAHAAHDRDVFHTAVEEELPPEGVAAFRSHVYPGKAKAIGGVYTAGVAVERAKWEAKIKSGEYVSRKTHETALQKVGQASYAKALGGNGGSASGQQLEGQAMNLSSSAEDQILANPNSDIKVVRKILARRNGEA